MDLFSYKDIQQLQHCIGKYLCFSYEKIDCQPDNRIQS